MRIAILSLTELLIILTISVSLLAACKHSDQTSLPEPCTDQWFTLIESKVITGDGHGHGPDIGSTEWKSVIEFKLGVRGKADIPARDSTEWCQFINALVIDQY